MIPTFTFSKNDLACFFFRTLAIPYPRQLHERHLEIFSYVPFPDDRRAQKVANDGNEGVSKFEGAPIASISGCGSVGGLMTG